MQNDLAQYVLSLSAADQALRADAGVLLARVVHGELPMHLLDALKAHDRLRTESARPGSEQSEADAAWEKVLRRAPTVRRT